MPDKTHCAGTKQDDTPCKTVIGLDAFGYCSRCRKRIKDSGQSYPPLPDGPDCRDPVEDLRTGSDDAVTAPPHESFLPDDEKCFEIRPGVDLTVSSDTVITRSEDASTEPDPVQPEQPFDQEIESDITPVDLPPASEPEDPPKPRGRPRRYILPREEALPELYNPGRRLYPCPKCRRVQLDNGSQSAAINQREVGSYVTFRCRSCDHYWTLPYAVFVFPKKPECPELKRGCGSQKTKATSTRGMTQYRNCDDCGLNFTITGEKK